MAEKNREAVFERSFSAKKALLAGVLGGIAFAGAWSHFDSERSVETPQGLVAFEHEQNIALGPVSEAIAMEDDGGIEEHSHSHDDVAIGPDATTGPEDSLNEIFFEEGYGGLDDEERVVFDGFVMLMQMLEIKDQDQLDRLIGSEGWSFVARPEQEGLRAVAIGGSRQIEFYARQDDTPAGVARILAHELGHAIDIESNTNVSRANFTRIAAQEEADWWPENRASDFDTGAGDYAESFAVWVHERYGIIIDDRSTISPFGNTEAANIYFDDLHERSFVILAE